MTTTRADHFQSVAKAHSVPVSVFRASDKTGRTVAARRELIHRLVVIAWAEAIMDGMDLNKANMLHSLPNVGRKVCKDHSTVWYHCQLYSEANYGTPRHASLIEMRLAYLNSIRLEPATPLSEIRAAYLGRVQAMEIAA